MEKKEPILGSKGSSQDLLWSNNSQLLSVFSAVRQRRVALAWCFPDLFSSMQKYRSMYSMPSQGLQKCKNHTCPWGLHGICIRITTFVLDLCLCAHLRPLSADVYERRLHSSPTWPFVSLRRTDKPPCSPWNPSEILSLCRSINYWLMTLTQSELPQAEPWSCSISHSCLSFIKKAKAEPSLGVLSNGRTPEAPQLSKYWIC